jgi:sec-independent protein translocase protein TatA
MREVHMLAEIFGVDGVIVLIVVVVLLFGGAAIPKLARNLGSAKNEFEKGLNDGKKASANTNLAASNGTSEATASPAPAPSSAPAPAPSPASDDPTSRS